MTFNITGVLSNVPYDIYLVTVPAQAETKNVSPYQRRPTKVAAYIKYKDENGDVIGRGNGKSLVSKLETPTESVGYLKLAEKYVFPTSNYGLTEDNPRITLEVSTDVKSRETRQDTGTHSAVMRIDCVILKPHVD